MQPQHDDAWKSKLDLYYFQDTKEWKVFFRHERLLGTFQAKRWADHFVKLLKDDHTFLKAPVKGTEMVYERPNQAPVQDNTNQ